MTTHLEIRDLPYPIEQLYQLVADVEHYPDFLPWCSAARILSETENEKVAELVISYKAFSESYTSLVKMVPPEKDQEKEATIEVDLIKGPFRKLKNYWVFRRIDDAHTQIEFFIEFEFKSVILDKLIGSMFEKAIHKMVGAFEERAKQFAN